MCDTCARHNAEDTVPASKPFWQSKTLWLNLIGIALLILATPEIVNVLPPDWRPEIGAVLAILNIVNRVLSTPTALTGGER